MNVNSKLQNFWYYHKVKVVVLILAIIVTLFAVALTGRNLTPDVQIGYVTDGRELPEEVKAGINEYLNSVIEDVNGDNEKVVSFSPLMGPRVDLEFVSEGSQIVLMDGNTLGKFKDSGVLEPLDEIIHKYGIDISKNSEVFATPENKKEKHVYALPVKNIEFLLKVGFPAEDYYLAIRVEYSKDKTSLIKNKNAYAVMNAILNFKK